MGFRVWGLGIEMQEGLGEYEAEGLWDCEGEGLMGVRVKVYISNCS